MRKFPKPKTISAHPLFIEEVARSAGGVLITIYKNSLPASPYSLYKQRESRNSLPLREVIQSKIIKLN